MAAPRQDDRLAHNIAQQLCTQSLDEGASIDIHARAGIVTLHGTAADELQAQRITAAAQNVQGVSRVENRMRITPNAAEDKPARTLVEDVRCALETGLPARGQRLVVDADAGTVYLSGIVPDSRTRQTALAIARGVDGVAAVQDNLLSEK